MTTRTYSLEEAALIIRGGSEKKHREWLRKQLVNRRLPGYKPGLSWRMTQEDVDVALAALRPAVVPSVPVASSLTRTSARRLAS